MTYHPYTTWFDAHGETTGEHLCDAWNARNAAELARCGDDPFYAMALQTPTWAPPTKVMLVMERVCGEAMPVLIGTRNNGMRSLGRGDKISCGDVAFIRDGELIDADTDLPFTHDPTTAKYVNVVRPFDEAHAYDPHAHEYPHISINQVPLMENVSGAGFSFRPENRPCKHVSPPNHGHGAACGCVIAMRETAPMIGRVKLADKPIDKRLIFAAVRNCEFCVGTGRIICDDERAGRVSASHAAGGYAEWRRENPPAPRRSLIDPNAVFGGIGADGIIVQARR